MAIPVSLRPIDCLSVIVMAFRVRVLICVAVRAFLSPDENRSVLVNTCSYNAVLL